MLHIIYKIMGVLTYLLGLSSNVQKYTYMYMCKRAIQRIFVVVDTLIVSSAIYLLHLIHIYMMWRETPQVGYVLDPFFFIV